MSEFSLVPLGQLAEIRMGQSPDSTYVYEGSEQGVPFLQGNAEFGVKHPAAKYSCTQPAKIAEQGSSLISVRAPVGETNIADQLYCIGRGLAAVKFHRYGASLGRELLSFSAKSLGKVSQGTTFAAIGGADLRTLLVADIPNQEAKVLERVLDTLDTQIQRTEALIAKLEKVKDGLLHDLLTRGIDENGRLRPSPEQAPELYKESPLGLIPREWGMHTTGELSTSIVPGRDKPTLSTSGLPWITISDLTEKVVKKSRHGLCVPLDEAKKSSLRSIPKDCVIMSCVGEFGIASVSGCEAVINQQLHCFIPNPGINEFWLMYSLRLKGEEIEKMATQTTIKYLNKTGCESISLSTPTEAEQNRIMSAISIFDDRLLREETLLKKMRDKKTGLMNDLLTGRVRVTPLLDQAQTTTPE
ncbi:restriction endonuclease subunit S [Halomonas sp.]|uniref:restriction endonuclease subunit S n=1 Tax=Halomonas sp. TaxID=1486246 RepID=UPI00262ECA84|nr:restriction endonuclease subunit S [Halomonas sp.]